MPSKRKGRRVRTPLLKVCSSVRQYAYHAISSFSEPSETVPCPVMRHLVTAFEPVEEWAVPTTSLVALASASNLDITLVPQKIATVSWQVASRFTSRYVNYST